MTSDHHPSTGAGNPHSPAPSLPVYAFCDLCGQAEEAELIRPYATTLFAAHLCPWCLREAEKDYREIQREEAAKSRNISRAALVCVVFWVAVAGVAIAWRWWR